MGAAGRAMGAARATTRGARRRRRRPPPGAASAAVDGGSIVSAHRRRGGRRPGARQAGEPRRHQPGRARAVARALRPRPRPRPPQSGASGCRTNHRERARPRRPRPPRSRVRRGALTTSLLLPSSRRRLVRVVRAGVHEPRPRRARRPQGRAGAQARRRAAARRARVSHRFRGLPPPRRRLCHQGRARGGHEVVGEGRGGRGGGLLPSVSPRAADALPRPPSPSCRAGSTTRRSTSCPRCSTRPASTTRWGRGGAGGEGGGPRARAGVASAGAPTDQPPSLFPAQTALTQSLMRMKDGTGRKPTLKDCLAETDAVAAAVVADLLAKTGTAPHEIDAVITSCSCFAPTPSMAAMIVNKFKMRKDCQTYSLAGMGCAASVLCGGHGGPPAGVHAAPLQGAHLQPRERDGQLVRGGGGGGERRTPKQEGLVVFPRFSTPKKIFPFPPPPGTRATKRNMLISTASSARRRGGADVQLEKGERGEARRKRRPRQPCPTPDDALQSNQPHTRALAPSERQVRARARGAHHFASSDAAFTCVATVRTRTATRASSSSAAWSTSRAPPSGST